MIKSIGSVETPFGPRFKVELTASGIPALTRAKLALAALMPGVMMRDSDMNKVDAHVTTLYYRGEEEWKQLTAEALNTRLKSGASFVKEVSSKRGEVTMVLNYRPAHSHVTKLLEGYLSELPEVKRVSVKEMTVSLKVRLMTNLGAFERKLRQHMRFGL